MRLVEGFASLITKAGRRVFLAPRFRKRIAFLGPHDRDGRPFDVLTIGMLAGPIALFLKRSFSDDDSLVDGAWLPALEGLFPPRPGGFSLTVVDRGGGRDS